MNRTVVITGGSRGIGRAMVQGFAAAGDRVVFSYLHQREIAEHLADELNQKGCSVLPVSADCRSKSETKALFSAAKSAFGAVSVLICNAGVDRIAILQETEDDDWDRMMDTSAKGAFLSCQAVLPDMLSLGGGRIITVSSMWGQVGASCEVAYSAAKAAVIGLTKALAKELGPSKINVNCIAPGVIETDMNRTLTAADRLALQEETPLGRIGTPEEIAQTALFLASDAASFITGQVLGVNGGFVI